MIDERTEQLINRRLDGQLTEAESLELDKQLIRSPEARAWMEQYERTDALASGALRAESAHDPSRDAPAEELTRVAVSRRRVWPAVRAGIALAAAVALAVVIGSVPANLLMRDTTLTDRDVPVVAPDEPAAVASAKPIGDPAAAAIIEGPRRQEQRILRDLFGVFDPQTESLYLLEVDRTETTIVPVSMNY